MSDSEQARGMLVSELSRKTGVSSDSLRKVGLGLLEALAATLGPDVASLDVIVHCEATAKNPLGVGYRTLTPFQLAALLDHDDVEYLELDTGGGLEPG